jgi:hypothetical protein
MTIVVMRWRVFRWLTVRDAKFSSKGIKGTIVATINVETEVSSVVKVMEDVDEGDDVSESDVVKYHKQGEESSLELLSVTS